MCDITLSLFRFAITLFVSIFFFDIPCKSFDKFVTRAFRKFSDFTFSNELQLPF